MKKKGEQFVLRPYTGLDLEDLVELDQACFAPPFRFSRSAMQRFVGARNAWVTVADGGDRILGFCIVHHEKDGETDLGYLVTIDVAEDARGSGLGRRMLSEGEAWVRGWRGAGMLLHVLTENTQATRFYERMGYRRIGSESGFYGQGLDAAIYWKEIAS